MNRPRIRPRPRVRDAILPALLLYAAGVIATLVLVALGA